MYEVNKDDDLKLIELKNGFEGLNKGENDGS